MKRKFFRKPIIQSINNKWYADMVKGVERYQEQNKCEDKPYKCSDCPFSVSPYCLLNILKKEFSKEKKQ